MCHIRSRYAALSTEMLETARGQLSFKQKVCCEVVCKEWRDLLRSPPQGLWGSSLRVRGVSASRGVINADARLR